MRFTCYASLQAYRLFFEKFPILFLALLNKIQQGGADALKVLKTVENFQSGEYVAENLYEGNLYKELLRLW